jgi:hypothetical protein
MSVRSLRQLLPLYLACYALWLALSALGVWLIFAARDTLFALSIWLRLNPWQLRAVDNFGIVTLGLIWLMCILFLEHSLRRGVEKHRLWGRAARAFVIVAVLLGLCYGVQMLIT